MKTFIKLAFASPILLTSASHAFDLSSIVKQKLSAPIQINQKTTAATAPTMPNALNGDTSDMDAVEAEFQKEQLAKQKTTNQTNIINNPPASNIQRAPNFPKAGDKKGWAEIERQAAERQAAFEESHKTTNLVVMALPRPNHPLSAKVILYSFGDVITMINCNNYDLSSLAKAICKDKKAALAQINMQYAFINAYAASSVFIKNDLARNSPPQIPQSANDAFDVIKESEEYVKYMQKVEIFAKANPTAQRIKFK